MANQCAAFKRKPSNNEFYTPPCYIERARAVMGGIDLDPASNELAQKTVRATRYFTADTDGLAQDWSGRIWINPPYELKLIVRFADKLVSSLPNIEQAVVLVNNAADTQWFAKLAKHASAFCFKTGRIRFDTPNGPMRSSPPVGQVFVYFGDQVGMFKDSFGDIGHILVPA